MKNNIPKIKDTVGYRLLKSVFTLYVFIALLVTFFHMYSEYSNEKNVVHEDMKNIEKIFLKQLTTSIWNFDTLLVEDIVSGILINPSIVGLSIKNNEEKILANFGIVDDSYKIDKNIVYSNIRDVEYSEMPYIYTFPLFNIDYNDGEILAYISLFSNDNVIYNQVKNNFFLIIINSIIKTLALWVIFLFFANRYLTKPFFEIITVTNKVDSKKLKHTSFKYDNDNKSEFDILKKTFNEMFQRLEHSYKELDISNKKNIDLNKNLEEKVQNRTMDLIEANDELAKTIVFLKETQNKLVESEKLASLGILVSGVAHEINTPIGIGITGVSHLINLTDDIKKKYNEDKMSEEDFLDFVEKTKELSLLIDSNLLRTADLVKSFKKISIENIDENKNEVNLYEVISKSVMKANMELTNPNILINIDCDKDLIIDIYEESFSQVILNFILNSYKHAFSLKEEGIIDIKVYKENDKLFIVHRDNGKGISSENLTKIFEPFFTTNRDDGGTGLGLNIIYNIVTKIFKGEITCNSKQGHGVEFIVSFPIEK